MIEETKDIKDFKKEEYFRQKYKRTREEFNKYMDRLSNFSDDLKAEFKTLTPEIKGFSALMHATVVGTVNHIRRGKLKKKDPLIQYLTEQFIGIQRKIVKFARNL